MTKLIEAARKQSTEMILVTLELTRNQTAEAFRMARAAMIEVYKEREGMDSANALMDQLGM